MSTPPDDAWTAARAAWPRVDVPRARFDAFMAEVRAGLPADAELAVTDLYLACACVDGVPGAHAAFEQALIARIPVFLSRVERDPAVIDEVAQRVRERLLVARPDRAARIADYRGRGSLTAWVRVTALRLHADLATEQGRASHDDDELPRLQMLAVGADIAVAKEEHRAAIERALSAVLRELPPREVTWLKLHYVDGLSLERIGKLHRVDKATISRWLRATRERILDDTLARVEEETGATADEVRSLLGLLASSLDVSLSGLLRADAPST